MNTSSIHTLHCHNSRVMYGPYQGNSVRTNEKNNGIHGWTDERNDLQNDQWQNKLDKSV